jgi:hypothetical protein
MDEKLRAMFDEFADQHGGDVAPPFTPAGAAAFDAWLLEPVPGRVPDISRALARVYEDRPDLRDAFPDAGGQDREALLAWVASSGVAEEPVLARLYQPDIAPDGAESTGEDRTGEAEGAAEHHIGEAAELSPALARLSGRRRPALLRLRADRAGSCDTRCCARSSRTPHTSRP